MAAYEVLLLNTAVPQIQAAQSGDTYVVPRDIAFSAALTINGGTANGVPYLNGSKVLTTGSALTFDGTTLTASASASATGNFKTTSSAAQVFNLTASNDANTTIGLGVFGSAAGTFGTLTAGTPFLSTAAATMVQNVQNASGAFVWGIGSTPAEQMRLTSTGLGIGTNSPSSKLHVKTGTNENFEVRSASAIVGSASGVALDALNDARNTVVDLVMRGTNMTLVGSGSTPMIFQTNTTERARITSGGDFQTSSGNSVMIGGTAARATTAGTNRLDIFDGTAPVGTLANGVSFYSASGEANVMDAAGNATLLSPHDAVTNEWIFRSKHTPTGKVLKIDVERLLKFVNDHFGLDAVHEFIEE